MKINKRPNMQTIQKYICKSIEILLTKHFYLILFSFHFILLFCFYFYVISFGLAFVIFRLYGAVDPMIPQSSGIASSAIPPNVPVPVPSECDSSFMYQSMYRQQPHPQLPTAPMHPIPSAFCPFPPQSQHDPMGKFASF